MKADFLDTEAYDFLRTDEHLGKHIILLGCSGSRAYGTNIDGSDTDVRGITLNRKSDLIGLTSYEQFEDRITDTVIYTFNKAIGLLAACNPNTIELLGLREEDYLYMNAIGQELLDNKKLFLSKRAINSFGRYAQAQLRRMQNFLARDVFPQEEREMHIFNSVKNAIEDYNKTFDTFDKCHARIYIDKAVNPEMETEIFLDATMDHLPLRDYVNMMRVMTNVVNEYSKLGKRNTKKDEKHLNKHAMHLIRLFMMAIDILEKGEINTYRGKEHDLLMDIRFGKYSNEKGFHSSFYELIDEYEKKLDYAAKNTELPDEPDMEAIGELVMRVNEKVVRDEI